jgi:hypothetical protein
MTTPAEKWTNGWTRFLEELQEMSKDFRTHEQIVADVTSRFSVTDLIEQTSEALDRGDELFYKATEAPEVIEQGTSPNLIDWWRVRSGEKVYECRRFKNFVWCSCKAFFFSRKMCKHLALTVGVYCQNCRTMRAKYGKHCHDCHYTINRFAAKSLATNG